jgi:hypothetical protein
MPDTITILAAIAYVSSVAAAYYYGRYRAYHDLVKYIVLVLRSLGARTVAERASGGTND